MEALQLSLPDRFQAEAVAGWAAASTAFPIEEWNRTDFSEPMSAVTPLDVARSLSELQPDLLESNIWCDSLEALHHFA